MRAYCCLMALLLGISGTFAADKYPSRPVRWIIPLAAGGSTDLISRVIAQGLTEIWHMQVVPDNRPGSGGTIGLAMLAKAAPDGYTIALAQISNVALAPGFYPRLSYDPIKDLAPVTLVLSAPMVLVANSSVPVKNVQDLIALARARPDTITFGSAGNGSIGHLAAEMLKSMSHIRMVHVPYKGASQAITDLVGGQIAICVTTIPPALPLINNHRLTALGVTSNKRLPVIPDVATIAEFGVKGYEAYNWFGVVAPAGMPAQLIKRLQADVVQILSRREVRERLVNEGGDIVGSTPEEFAAFVRAEIPKWAKVIKESGAKVE